MKSIKELRENLERAQAEYLAEKELCACSGQLLSSLHSVTIARHEYQHACTGIVESLIACKCEASALDIITLELWK